MENFTANSRFIQTSENALIPSMKSLPEETEIEPFSMKFFIKMIRLEELIYSNDMDQQTLGDLLSLYAKCVEHYDIEKDSIKFYFIEKIQSIISNKQTLMLILKNTKDNSLIDKTENEKQIEIIQSIEEIKSSDDDISFNEKSTSKNLKYVKERKSLTTKNLKKNFSKLNFASISHKKIERAKKMNLFLKLQEDKKEQNINEMINLYTERCQRNDELVKEDINSQNSFIKARMEQKKKLMETSVKKSKEIKIKLTKFYSVEDIALKSTQNYMHNKTKREWSPFKPKIPEENEK